MKIWSALIAIAFEFLFDGNGVAGGANPEVLLKALHRVQDGLAHGELAAEGAQAELLLRLQTALAEVGGTPAAQHRWDETTIGYALSGGFSNQADNLLAKIPSNSPLFAIGRAISSYSNGDMEAARKQFQSLDVDSLPNGLKPYFNFASGTANLRRNNSQSLLNFERAILEAPGTLLEEVALRRLIQFALDEKNVKRFRRFTNLYFRRYLDSPFSNQLIDLYLDGSKLILENEAIIQDISLICSLPSNKKMTAISNFSYKAFINGNLELLGEILQIYFSNECGNDRNIFDEMDFYRSISTIKNLKEPIFLNKIFFWRNSLKKYRLGEYLEKLIPIYMQIFRPIGTSLNNNSIVTADIGLKNELAINQNFWNWIQYFLYL